MVYDTRGYREQAARERLVQYEFERVQVNPGESTRHRLALMAPEGSIGCECGVDTGQLSERFIQLNHFESFHCVDIWGDAAHPEPQYWAVCQKLMKYPEARIWRMTAQKFSELVPKEFFGFIYMDCYAHTGQDAGGVLEDMWECLQPGGLFAGDDYDEKQWPINFETVNKFAEKVGRKVEVFDEHLTQERPVYDTYASWYFHK